MIELLIIFSVSAFGLAWPVLGYPLVVRWCSRLNFIPHPISDPVSVIIPCYNEAAVIGHKLENTLAVLGARQSEILVVDDGSTDDTARIVRQYQASHPTISIQSLPRSGKNAALNAGFRNSKYDLVIVSDANAVVEAGAIDRLLEPLADGRVGGVRGRYEPKTSGQTAAAVGTVAYQRREHGIFVQESERGMLINSGGVLQAWRKRLIRPDEERTMAEDWDMALAVRATGSFIYYEHRAAASKRITTRTAELLRQNIRLVYGTIQTAKKYFRLLNPWRYGRLSLSFSSGKLLQICGPWFLLVFVASSATLGYGYGLRWAIKVLWVVIALAAIGLLSMVINFRSTRSSWPITSMLEYVAMTEVAAVAAWWLFFRHRGRNWTGWTPLASVRHQSPS